MDGNIMITYYARVRASEADRDWHLTPVLPRALTGTLQLVAVARGRLLRQQRSQQEQHGPALRLQPADRCGCSCGAAAGSTAGSMAVAAFFVLLGKGNYIIPCSNGWARA